MVRDRLSVSQLRVRFMGFMAVLGCLLVAWAGLGLTSEVVADDAMDLKQQVIAEVNLRRTEAGVPPVEISPFLSTAAQAHAEYLIANAAQWAYGLDAHYEVPSYPSYYAASPAERAVKAGMASGNDISEDVLLGYGNTSGGAAFVVGAWINAPLHRRAIIDRAIVEAGFGWATDDPKYAYVYNAVSDRSADARSGEVQEYPADGMTGIPWGWDGIESPQPSRRIAIRISGKGIVSWGVIHDLLPRARNLGELFPGTALRDGSSPGGEIGRVPLRVRSCGQATAGHHVYGALRLLNAARLHGRGLLRCA